MERGNRVIYNQDGKILLQSGEATGDILAHDEIIELHFIDLEYGSINYSKQYVESIDVNTNQPVLKDVPLNLTEEQKRIQELENQILLNENEKVGGLL